MSKLLIVEEYLAFKNVTDIIYRFFVLSNLALGSCNSNQKTPQKAFPKPSVTQVTNPPTIQ